MTHRRVEDSEGRGQAVDEQLAAGPRTRRTSGLRWSNSIARSRSALAQAGEASSRDEAGPPVAVLDRSCLKSQDWSARYGAWSRKGRHLNRSDRQVVGMVGARVRPVPHPVRDYEVTAPGDWFFRSR